MFEWICCVSVGVGVSGCSICHVNVCDCLHFVHVVCTWLDVLCISECVSVCVCVL